MKIQDKSHQNYFHESDEFVKTDKPFYKADLIIIFYG